MSDVKAIIKELRKIGAKCRKQHQKEEYVCYLEGAGEGFVEIVVNPEDTVLKLTTDTDVTESYVEYVSGEFSAFDEFKDLADNLNARKVDIITEVKGRGKPAIFTERFVIIFDTKSANPKEISRIAKNIADKDIWIDIRYRARIIPKMGNEMFKDTYEFVEELLK